MGQKSLFEAYLVAFTPLGLFGGLHFYLNRPHIGLLYFCTVGVFGIGYLVDLFRVPLLVKEYNARDLQKKDPTKATPPQKSIVDAYLMWFPMGLFGLHHAYLKDSNWAMLYLGTIGLFGVGWIVDGFWMVSMVRKLNAKMADPKEVLRKKEKKAMRERLENGEVELDNADVLASVADSKSIGRDGLSTDRQNTGRDRLDRLDVEEPAKKDKEMRAVLALGLSPTGLFGSHHWYLGRRNWGLLYLCTFGLAGLGWILDWFRLPFLLRRTNAIRRGEADKKTKAIDDTYVLWLPWGLFGLHQFYLGRKGWGLVYLLTVGVFGIGWLMDVARIPILVKETNQRRVDSDSKAEDVEANITPAADDYDDNSLTLNLPNGQDDEIVPVPGYQRQYYQQQQQQQQQQQEQQQQQQLASQRSGQTDRQSDNQLPALRQQGVGQ